MIGPGATLAGDGEKIPACEPGKNSDQTMASSGENAEMMTSKATGESRH